MQNKNRKLIHHIFCLVKKYKPHIVDCYSFSDLKNPIKGHIKYPEKLYIKCILEVLSNGSYWTRYNGSIPGKQLNKRHNEYVSHGIYDQIFNKTLRNYLRRHIDKQLIHSVDSTNIKNKLSVEAIGRNPYYKNKRGIKISTIVDSIGSPISIAIDQVNIHDSKIIDKNIDQLKKHSKKINKSKRIFLADSAYDSDRVRILLIKNKYKKVITPRNIRNTKNIEIINSLKLTDSEKELYKNRVRVENFFAIIRKYPKIECIYEKKISSYLGLLLLACSSLLINR